MPEPALWDSLAPFAQYLINGLTFGALIALIALGYTMVYGIVELINFAHGDLFMLGSFVSISVLALLGFGGLGFEATVSNANPYLIGYVLFGCAVFAFGQVDFVDPIGQAGFLQRHGSAKSVCSSREIQVDHDFFPPDG